MACELNAHSIINVGWRRSKRIDIPNSLANLNNITHCEYMSVRREFLDKIILFRDEVLGKFKKCYIFYIHGMSNIICEKAKERVDIVIGYGQGTPPSYTCNLDYKTAF